MKWDELEAFMIATWNRGKGRPVRGTTEVSPVTIKTYTQRPGQSLDDFIDEIYEAGDLEQSMYDDIFSDEEGNP